MGDSTRYKQRNSEENQTRKSLSGNLQKWVEKIGFDNGTQYNNA